jgi:plastocyanin
VIRRAATPAWPSMHRLLTATCLLAATVAAALGGAAAPVGAAGRAVTLKDISFAPKRLAVSKGATVTFRWRDGGTRHDVTSVGHRRFKSIASRTAGDRSVRFSRAGTYRYVCTLHPGMAGSIVVR